MSLIGWGKVASRFACIQTHCLETLKRSASCLSVRYILATQWRMVSFPRSLPKHTQFAFIREKHGITRPSCRKCKFALVRSIYSNEKSVSDYFCPAQTKLPLSNALFSKSFRYDQCASSVQAKYCSIAESGRTNGERSLK